MKRIVFLCAGLTMALAAPAQAEEHDGDVTLTYQSISALTETGQPDPAHDADCQASYGEWVGRSVETAYRIDTQTLMMSATSTIEGEAVDLFPLGIQGIYAFMSDGVPPSLEEQGVIRVLFEISLGFQEPESRLMTTLNDSVNCLIES